MKVQRIQNNNYNPNFQAKLNLLGFTDDIPYHRIQQLKQKALSVGTMKDSINLLLSEPKVYGESFATPFARRNIEATTIINNELVHDKEPIGYFIKGRTDNLSLTINTIRDYLDFLITELAK